MSEQPLTAEPLERWAHHDDYCPAVGAKGACNCGLAEALDRERPTRAAERTLDVEALAGALYRVERGDALPTTERREAYRRQKASAIAREYAALTERVQSALGEEAS